MDESEERGEKRNNRLKKESRALLRLTMKIPRSPTYVSVYSESPAGAMRKLGGFPGWRRGHMRTLRHLQVLEGWPFGMSAIVTDAVVEGKRKAGSTSV